MEKEILEKENIRVGISVGDINGIGPEVILKSLRDNMILTDITPVIYGSAKVLSYYKKGLGMHDFNYQSCRSGKDVVNKKVNVINVWSEEVKIEPGNANSTGGTYAVKSLEAAVKDLAEGEIDVLVTAPFSKETVQKAGLNFPGHTEYLADKSQVKEALMILVSNELRVALVTTHIPLKEVPTTLTKEKILEKIEAFASSLKKDFGIVRPKIAVLGLNPHAGENGKLGTEEQEIIAPAIHQAKSNGILAFGPFPSDGFFGSTARSKYDGVLSMYHDQGLTGFKAIAFEDGVNFTAGLPIVRTSPDHGTAFDIAGKNSASELSFRSAIYLAVDVFKKRKLYKMMNENPLPIRKVESENERDN